MTFRKVHKRADTPNQRRQIGPLLASTTTTSHAATSTSSTQAPAAPSGFDPPSGPPLMLSTTSRSSTVSGSSSATVSSVSSSSTVSSTSATTVPTTPPAAAANTSTRTTAPAITVPRSTVRVTASNTTSSTPTATAPPDSGGMSVGSMAGIAAAALIGIGVITAFVVWFMRRRNKNHDIDEEPFNRNSFLRHSTALPDDDAPLPSRTRPPPSMAERQPTPVYGGAQTYNDMGQNAFGYNTQPSYGAQHGQTFNHPYGPGGAPATPLPYSPGFGTAYDQQQGFNNGGYADLTRGAPNHEYPPSPHGYDQYENPHSPQYVGHDNFPMPPAAAAGSGSHGDSVHYPELTPATTSAQQGQVVSVSDSVYNSRETPVQLGFAPASGTPAHAQQGRGPNHGARPETVYDTEDAYGGI